MFENKKIYILGMSKSGYEAAKFLANYNNKIVITDSNEQDKEHIEELKKLGVEVIITDKQEEFIDESFNYMIKNPGIKYDNKSVVKAKNLNIKVINELEMAYEFLNKNCTIIGVTGSNGKTTTVTLIYQMLLKAKFPVHLGGNIGTPVAKLINDVKKDDYLVLEISDHQLCDMYNFKTNISVITNIFDEVHIDFHDSFDRYKNIKKRIFNNHTTNDLAIINYDNNNVLEITNSINSKKQYFSKKEKKDCYLNNKNIYFKNELIINLDEIKIKGMHNYENIMAAIAVCKNLNVSNEVIKEVLTTFSGVEHRIEFVDSIASVSYYNDSKSTNNKATITALLSFDKPTILLMGGLDRNLSFDELKDYMINVKEIICFGETKNKIKSFADKYNIKCIVMNNLEEATMKASSEAEAGDVVLLSPACASWDQYKSFEERGLEFKNIINKLNI
ncbi:MAG: UDP-N-acetylmuramoyl-L-alanine--D-glutamate ligase [Bacilli bacterium]|nr:UDP-N-acetylmuramoyl-L-alanine--D-glutamate ligase [Bacilli bacterium]